MRLAKIRATRTSGSIFEPNVGMNPRGHGNRDNLSSKTHTSHSHKQNVSQSISIVLYSNDFSNIRCPIGLGLHFIGWSSPIATSFASSILKNLISPCPHQIMPMYNLYSHPYRKIYKASLCSKASFFQLISFALT